MKTRFSIRRTTLDALAPLAVGSIVGVASMAHALQSDGAISVGLSLSAVVFLAVPLVAASVWFTFRDRSAAEAGHVAVWSTLGAVPLAGFALAAVAYQHAQDVAVADPGILVVWLAGIGAVGGTITGVYDARRAREHTLYRETAQRQRQILSQTHDGIAICQDGRYQYVNDRLTEITDFERAELLGEPIETIIALEDREMVRDRYQRRMAGEDPPAHYEVALQSAGGQKRVAELRATRITYEGETADLLTIRDVTEYRELETQRRRYQQAIESSGDLLAAIDADGNYLLANESYREYHGVAADSIRGRAAREVIGADQYEDVEPHLQAALDGETVQYEMTRTHPTSGERTLDIRYYPLRGGDGTIQGVVAAMRDVTERKERERELERSRKRLRALFEESPDVIVVHDAEGNVIDINEQHIENLGYSREELLSMNVADFEVSHSPQALREQWAEMDVGDRLKLVGEHQRKDGTTFPTEIWVNKIELEGEQRFIAQSRDVTERKEREEELHIKTRAMTEAPVGIVITDPSRDDNPIIYANREFEEITGYSREEVEGRNCRFLQGEETREGPVARLREAVDAAEPASVELRNYRKDGSLFWNYVSIAPVRDDDGTVTHFVGFQQDVTERKQHEQDLKLFERAVEEAGHAVLLTDRNGVIEYVNPAFEEQTGYSRSEAVGRTPSILKSGKYDEVFYEDLWETILSGEMWEAELTNQTKSGELYQIEQTIAPITNDEGEITHFVGIEFDVTDRKLREQRLSVLNRIFRHNLRNTITVIEGHANVLRSAVDDDAVSNVDAILNRTAELEEISKKADSVQQFFDRDSPDRTLTCHLDALLADVEAEMRERYPDAEFSVEHHETTVAAASDMLTLALREAIENAVTHTEQAQPTVDISVMERPNENHVEIAVADTGPGIPEAERGAIERGEETQLMHSSGLGLWLIHWVVAEFGGEVLITDNEPRGSVVRLRLPTV